MMRDVEDLDDRYYEMCGGRPDRIELGQRQMRELEALYWEWNPGASAFTAKGNWLYGIPVQPHEAGDLVRMVGAGGELSLQGGQ